MLNTDQAWVMERAFRFAIVLFSYVHISGTDTELNLWQLSNSRVIKLLPVTTRKKYIVTTVMAGLSYELYHSYLNVDILINSDAWFADSYETGFDGANLFLE